MSIAPAKNLAGLVEQRIRGLRRTVTPEIGGIATRPCGQADNRTSMLTPL